MIYHLYDVFFKERRFHGNLHRKRQGNETRLSQLRAKVGLFLKFSSFTGDVK